MAAAAAAAESTPGSEAWTCSICTESAPRGAPRMMQSLVNSAPHAVACIPCILGWLRHSLQNYNALKDFATPAAVLELGQWLGALKRHGATSEELTGLTRYVADVQAEMSSERMQTLKTELARIAGDVHLRSLTIRAIFDERKTLHDVIEGMRRNLKEVDRRHDAFRRMEAQLRNLAAGTRVPNASHLQQTLQQAEICGLVRRGTVDKLRSEACGISNVLTLPCSKPSCTGTWRLPSRDDVYSCHVCGTEHCIFCGDAKSAHQQQHESEGAGRFGSEASGAERPEETSAKSPTSPWSSSERRDFHDLSSALSGLERVAPIRRRASLFRSDVESKEEREVVEAREVSDSELVDGTAAAAAAAAAAAEEEEEEEEEGEGTSDAAHDDEDDRESFNTERELSVEELIAMGAMGKLGAAEEIVLAWVSNHLGSESEQSFDKGLLDGSLNPKLYGAARASTPHCKSEDLRRMQKLIFTSRNCPRCRILITRANACPNVTCDVCRLNFNITSPVVWGNHRRLQMHRNNEDEDEDEDEDDRDNDDNDDESSEDDDDDDESGNDADGGADGVARDMPRIAPDGTTSLNVDVTFSISGSIPHMFTKSLFRLINTPDLQKDGLSISSLPVAEPLHDSLQSLDRAIFAKTLPRILCDDKSTPFMTRSSSVWTEDDALREHMKLRLAFAPSDAPWIAHANELLRALRSTRFTQPDLQVAAISDDGKTFTIPSAELVVHPGFIYFALLDNIACTFIVKQVRGDDVTVVQRRAANDDWCDFGDDETEASTTADAAAATTTTTTRAVQEDDAEVQDDDDDDASKRAPLPIPRTPLTLHFWQPQTRETLHKRIQKVIPQQLQEEVMREMEVGDKVSEAIVLKHNRKLTRRILSTQATENLLLEARLLKQLSRIDIRTPDEWRRLHTRLRAFSAALHNPDLQIVRKHQFGISHPQSIINTLQQRIDRFLLATTWAWRRVGVNLDVNTK
jgi:hypothetical protein